MKTNCWTFMNEKLVASTQHGYECTPTIWVLPWICSHSGRAIRTNIIPVYTEQTCIHPKFKSHLLNFFTCFLCNFRKSNEMQGLHTSGSGSSSETVLFIMLSYLPPKRSKYTNVSNDSWKTKKENKIESPYNVQSESIMQYSSLGKVYRIEGCVYDLKDLAVIHMSLENLGSCRSSNDSRSNNILHWF